MVATLRSRRVAPLSAPAGGDAASATGVPQLGQKRAFCVTLAPQVEHDICTGVPQL